MEIAIFKFLLKSDKYLEYFLKLLNLFKKNNFYTALYRQFPLSTCLPRKYVQIYFFNIILT